MQTQDNGYHMEVSSKYDQSGMEPSFLPLHARFSTPCPLTH